MPDPAADSGHAAVTVSRKHENVIIFVVDVVNGSMYDGFRMIPVSGIRILPVLPVLLYFISSYEDRGGVRIRISILILTFFDSCFYSRSRDQKTIRSKKMARIHRPDRGSRAYSPRKRAKSHIPRFRSWPTADGQPKLQAFAGYKAGMTHVIMVDDIKNSMTAGTEISVPVTIIETPAIHVAAIRAYVSGENGNVAAAEAWAENLEPELSRRIKVPKTAKTAEALAEIEDLLSKGLVTDIKAITYTTPKAVRSIPKKVPDVMETGISGNDMKAVFDYAKSILGTAVAFSDLFKAGAIVDTAAITTGKGTQGPVKRWGIALMKGKHSRQGSLRQIGNLGPRGVCRVFWVTPQMGQTGYHQRTEYNKRILKIGTDGAEITPAGGILNYGEVTGDYILVKGSVPGPSKRLIRIRDPIRNKMAPLGEPKIVYVSVQSQQG